MNAYIVNIVTNERVLIDRSCYVEFTDGDRSWVRASVRDGVCEISGSRPLIVRPRVSNVINVDLAP